MSTIDEIRARAAAARPGPWAWFGDTKMKNVYLATNHSGRVYVMAFERWGMQGARPWFQGPEGDEKIVGMPVVYEVAPDATSDDDPRLYRHTIRSIRNADAEFIAHSRQDVDDLVAEVDRLTKILSWYQREDMVDVPGWVTGLVMSKVEANGEWFASVTGDARGTGHSVTDTATGATPQSASSAAFDKGEGWQSFVLSEPEAIGGAA